MNVLASFDFGAIPEFIDSLGKPGKAILAVIVFLIGKSIVKGISKVVEKSLSKTNLDDKLAKIMGSKQGSSEKMIASFVYGILLLFIIILSLNIAGLTKVIEPLQNLLDQILGALPKILVAGIVIYLGTVLAKIVKGLVGNVLNTARIDERLGNKSGATPISSAISTVLYSFIILLFLPVALGFLEMPELSEPIAGITEKILGSIPNILIAGILIAVGVTLGQIAQKLITNLLSATGIDNFPAKMGLAIPATGKNSISGIAGLIVFISILVLLVSTAIDQLNLGILSEASGFVLGGYFNVLLSVLIFGAGFVAAKFAYSQLADKNLMLAKVVNGAILFVSAVVALNRSRIAPDITGLPFNVIVIALGFAAGIGGAIALGLGGKDYIARFLERRG